VTLTRGIAMPRVTCRNLTRDIFNFFFQKIKKNSKNSKKNIKKIKNKKTTY